jgi:predicted KAP-like P-loop ATPase
LNGGWGEGKTSLLKHVYNGFRDEEGKQFKVLWFNARQYERLDPVLALLQNIANFYDDDEHKAKELNDVIKGLGLVFLDVVSRKTIGLTLEDIKGKFKSSVKEIQAIHTIIENLIGNNKKLIIFVDDLDRCSIDNTLNVLESIKLLFNAKNTKFVVGADMKMLETAWALKHQHTLIESPYTHAGREHIDKIFQLTLSLPSKALIPSKEYESAITDDENDLIKGYIERLAPDLPVILRNLIADSFPPNRRKIKRAMSLAYFIGKNLDEGKFRRIFLFVVFWTAIVTYFHDLARVAKICLVYSTTSSNW